jgi:hypothetical protein
MQFSLSAASYLSATARRKDPLSGRKRRSPTEYLRCEDAQATTERAFSVENRATLSRIVIYNDFAVSVNVDQGTT